MGKRIQVYRTESITVTFDPNVCIHSAECLRGDPEVFDVRRARWIRPELAPAEKVAEVVRRCPSGALQATLHTAEVPAEPPSTQVVVEVRKDGPLVVSGPVRIEAHDGALVCEQDRVALCRCGGSARKPYCDGTHTRIGFRDPA
jgi:uncharacterized Fe-S cluster protein YjdI